jgi:hypothetical protein
MNHHYIFCPIYFKIRGRHGRDRMVVGFTKEFFFIIWLFNQKGVKFIKKK